MCKNGWPQLFDGPLQFAFFEEGGYHLQLLQFQNEYLLNNGISGNLCPSILNISAPSKYDSCQSSTRSYSSNK